VRPPFGVEWARVLLPVLLVAAAVEGALLQVRDGYFTGGFLNEHYPRTKGAVAAFFGAAALHDFLLYGLAAAALLAVARRRGAAGGGSERRVFRLAALVSLAPVLFAIFEYHVLNYVRDLGDVVGATASAGSVGAGLRYMRDEIVRAGLGLVLGGVAFTILLGPVLRRAARLPAPPLGGWAVAWALAGALAATAVLDRAPAEDLREGLKRKLSYQLVISLLDRASDRDGDGAGDYAYPRDPDPDDPAVHPYAKDVPGDGKDQDGIGGDCPVDAPVVTPPAPPAPPPGAPRRDVVLIVLESFRADLVGRTFRGREVCPNLTRLAGRAASARLAFSHRGYTAPTLFQILTGRYQAPPGGARSLFEDLRDLGFQTAAFSCPDQDFADVHADTRMAAAEVYFDAKDARDSRLFPSADATHLMLSEARVNRAIREFLTGTRRDPSRPLFLFVNYQSTHFPYSHRETRPILTDRPIPRGSIRPGNRDWVEESYLNAAANVDQDLGELLADLEAARLLDEALVIVTADHGESIYDDGFLGHGHRLLDVETRVPFLVLNAGAGTDLVEPLGLVEVRSLVLSALSRPASPSPAAFRTDPSKRVFQYIDDIAWPRELGWTTAAGRTRIDLSRHLVREERRGAEAEARPRPLDPERDRHVLELIWAWERLRNELP